jgi:hypothetical protein
MTLSARTLTGAATARLESQSPVFPLLLRITLYLIFPASKYRMIVQADSELLQDISPYFSLLQDITGYYRLLPAGTRPLIHFCYYLVTPRAAGKDMTKRAKVTAWVAVSWKTQKTLSEAV